MTEIEYLTELALAVQRLLRDDPKHLIVTSPRGKRLFEEVTDALRHWEDWSEDNLQREDTAELVCGLCDADIIMARCPSEDRLNEFVVEAAFETESVLASGLAPSYNWQLDFTTNPPTAVVNMSLRTGTVWIRHEWVCGSLPKPSVNSAIYRRRHATNVLHVKKAMDHLAESMQAKLRHLRRMTDNEEHGD